jgi:hypothetical protein
MDDFTDRDGPEPSPLVTKPSSHDRQVQVLCLPERFTRVPELALDDDERSLPL